MHAYMHANAYTHTHPHTYKWALQAIPGSLSPGSSTPMPPIPQGGGWGGGAGVTKLSPPIAQSSPAQLNSVL